MSDEQRWRDAHPWDEQPTGGPRRPPYRLLLPVALGLLLVLVVVWVVATAG